MSNVHFDRINPQSEQTIRRGVLTCIILKGLLCNNDWLTVHYPTYYILAK